MGDNFPSVDTGLYSDSVPAVGVKAYAFSRNALVYFYRAAALAGLCANPTAGLNVKLNSRRPNLLYMNNASLTVKDDIKVTDADEELVKRANKLAELMAEVE